MEINFHGVVIKKIEIAIDGNDSTLLRRVHNENSYMVWN